MTTYVISQQDSNWRVDRYSTDHSRTMAGVGNEKDALDLAIRKAKEDGPSQVLRVDLRGDSNLIAKFSKKSDA